MLRKYMAIKNAITSIAIAVIIYSCLVEVNPSVKAIVVLIFANALMGVMCEADKLYLYLMECLKNKKSA